MLLELTLHVSPTRDGRPPTATPSGQREPPRRRRAVPAVLAVLHWPHNTHNTGDGGQVHVRCMSSSTGRGTACGTAWLGTAGTAIARPMTQEGDCRAPTG